MAIYKSESGFTLLELIISVGVIGVLTAIALPNFYDNKMDAYDSEAKAILRRVAVAEEAHFLTHDQYIGCDHKTCSALLDNIGNIPEDIILKITTDGYSYTGSVSHKKGSGDIFNLN